MRRQVDGSDFREHLMPKAWQEKLAMGVCLVILVVAAGFWGAQILAAIELLSLAAAE